MDVAIAAKRVRVTADRLRGWEEGSASPSVAQLRQLAEVYKRPLAAFFLPEPPPDHPLPVDYRRPAHARQEVSFQLRLAHREVVYRRTVALELAQASSVDLPQFHLSVGSTGDAERAAETIRAALGVALEPDMESTDGYHPLRVWRTACEDAGILVCQAQRIPSGEMSGFSVHESPLPVIVLNPKDHPHRRLFTLLHEVAHLAAHQGGICDTRAPSPAADPAEAKCNAIAAATLVPRADLVEQPLVSQHGSSPAWSDHDLRGLARRYGVSREVVLRRLLALELSDEGFYRQRRATFAAEYERFSHRASRGSPPPATAALSRCGPTFARLVLRAYGSDVVSLRDACDYLGVGPKQLQNVADQAFGWKDAGVA